MRHPALLLAAGLALMLPSAALAKPKPATSSVDCTDPDPSKHDHIADALEVVGDPLTIEIRGICHEDVLIERDNVTLIGSDPTVDGIQAVDTENIRGSAVYVRNARFVRLENLHLSGGVWSGVRVMASDTVVEVVSCVLEDNGVQGLGAIYSVVVIEDSIVRDNPRGVTAFGGQLFCTRCSIESASSFGLLAFGGADSHLTDSTVDAATYGVFIIGASPATINGSEITSPSFALVATDGGNIDVLDSTFSGSVLAQRKSLLTLTDSEQTANPVSFNSLELDSTLQMDGDSTLVGPTFLNRFATTVITDTSTLDGDLHCASGSDAYCDDPLTQVTGVSSCGLCM